MKNEWVHLSFGLVSRAHHSLWGRYWTSRVVLLWRVSLRKYTQWHVGEGGGGQGLCLWASGRTLKNDKENSISFVCTGKWNHLALYFPISLSQAKRISWLFWSLCWNKDSTIVDSAVNTIRHFFLLQAFQFPATPTSAGRMMKMWCKDCVLNFFCWSHQ